MSPSTGAVGEEEPLLRHEVESQDSYNDPAYDSSASPWTPTLQPILIYTFCLQFLTYFAKHVIEVPIIKLFEQAICNRYYAAAHSQAGLGLALSDVDESHCKIPAIQTELAALVGLKFTFDALPGLVTALYWGSIADRFGRRLVLALCCIGTLCSLLWILFVCYAGLNLPVKLVWLSSIFLCLGGSQRVAKGMNFTIVADSTKALYR